MGDVEPILFSSTEPRNGHVEKLNPFAEPKTLAVVAIVLFKLMDP